MGFGCNGGEGEFGERLRDADYGFELADGDGDAGACGGEHFGGVHLFADGDEVRGELFGGLGGEARCASSRAMIVRTVVKWGRE